MIQENRFKFVETISTIKELQNSAVKGQINNTALTRLQSQVLEIQKLAANCLNLEAKENLALAIYPVALEAKHAFEAVQGLNAPLKEIFLELTSSIVDSFAKLNSEEPLLNLNNANDNDGDADSFIMLSNYDIKALDQIHIDTPQKWIVKNAERYKTTLQQVKFNKNLSSVIIPQRLITESFSDSLIQKKCSNDDFAEEHLIHKPNERALTVKKSKNSSEWKAVRFEKQSGNLTAFHGQVASTTHSNRKLHKIPLALTNIHYQEVNGQLCVTCGVINSIDKAQELMNVIRQIKGNEPVKVMINQLNSYWNEKDLVQSEHISSLHLGKELGSVVHLNHCMSAFSKLPSSYEDGQSYRQNYLGLATLCNWASVDTTEFTNLIKIISVSRKEKDDLKKQIKRLENSSSSSCCNLNAPPEANEVANLKKRLSDVSNKLLEFEKKLNLHLQTTAKDCQKKSETLYPTDLRKSLILKIIGMKCLQETYSSGYDPKLGRVTEVELNLLLCMLMKDTVVVINCKSGLDRTGFIKGVWEGLNQMRKKFMKEGLSEERAIEKLFDLVSTMDESSLELDKIAYDVAYRHPNALITDFKDTHKAISGKELLNEFNTKLNGDLKNVLYYKQQILKSLLKVALPATIESTGLPGLKYGHDRNNYGANPHPFWRLPPFVQTDDEKVVQLYTAGGMIYYHWPTEAGKQLLLRNSRCRGD